jgi:FkbM family methyltransferase
MTSQAKSAHAALWLYRTVKRTRLLELAPVKRLFYDAYFLYKRWWEDPFAQLVDSHPSLFREGLIIDVGANLGYTALLFARAGGEGSEVVAFEPDPANLESMREIVRRRNPKARITFAHAAVGAGEGFVQLWLNPNHHADHRVATASFKESPEFKRYSGDSPHTISVPLVSLDTYMAQHFPNTKVCFIKIDVQGYELGVCQGMSQLLSNNPDATVAFEYTPASLLALGFEPQELLGFFLSRGIPLYLLDRKRGIVPFSSARLEEELSRRGYVDLIASRRALN